MDMESLVQQYVSKGWSPDAARADIQAGGWQNKEWLTGAGGGIGFSFDQKGAEAKAMAELTPYYDKLLKMYGGDVALAKQRIDQDYERGLRVKTTNTDWEKQTNDISLQERQRKFKIALNDMDQQMNQRGLATSGIAQNEKAQATKDEMYQQDQITRSQQELDRGLQQYKEQAGTDYTRAMEDKGYMTPTTTPVTGQFAPQQDGIKSPGASYNISNFAPETAQKELALAEQKKADAYTKALNARSQAFETWSTDATRLAKM